jgi:hypothetical protein
LHNGGSTKKFEKKREGKEGGELSFQCLRPSTSLMAEGSSMAGEIESF